MSILSALSNLVGYGHPTKLRPGCLESPWKHQKDLRKPPITKGYIQTPCPAHPDSSWKRGLRMLWGIKSSPGIQAASLKKKRNIFPGNSPFIKCHEGSCALSRRLAPAHDPLPSTVPPVPGGEMQLLSPFVITSLFPSLVWKAQMFYRHKIINLLRFFLFF